jgi:hypothetical protein
MALLLKVSCSCVNADERQHFADVMVDRMGKEPYCEGP